MKLILRRYRVVWTRYVDDKGVEHEFPDGAHRASEVTFGEARNAIGWADEALANERVGQLAGKHPNRHTGYEIVPEDFAYYAGVPRVEEDGAVYHLDRGDLFEPDDVAPVGVALGEPAPKERE